MKQISGTIVMWSVVVFFKSFSGDVVDTNESHHHQDNGTAKILKCHYLEIWGGGGAIILKSEI